MLYLNRNQEMIFYYSLRVLRDTDRKGKQL